MSPRPSATRNAMSQKLSTRSSDPRTALWAGITALAAVVAFGIVVPRLAGHGEAHASATPTRSAANATLPRPMTAPMTAHKATPSPLTWDSTVPAASGVFVNPESGAVVSAPAATF